MNVVPVARGIAEAVLRGLQAIWPDLYAVTVVCARCHKPYTYQTANNVFRMHSFRRYCDECSRIISREVVARRNQVRTEQRRKLREERRGEQKPETES